MPIIWSDFQRHCMWVFNFSQQEKARNILPVPCSNKLERFLSLLYENPVEMILGVRNSPRALSVMWETHSTSAPLPDPDRLQMAALTCWPFPIQGFHFLLQSEILAQALAISLSTKFNQYWYVPMKSFSFNKSAFSKRKTSGWKTPSPLTSLLSATESQYYPPSSGPPLRSNFLRKLN